MSDCTACFACGATDNLRPYQSLTAGTLKICPRCLKAGLDRNEVAEYARLLTQARRLPDTARNKARLVADLEKRLTKAKTKIK